MKKNIIISLIIMTAGFTHAQETEFSWPEGKEAAVCLTYDDALDCHLDNAIPALNKYNFRGTFYCTGNSPSLQNRLEEWRTAAGMGHELGNHTLFHPCNGEGRDWVKEEYDLRTYSLEQIISEIFTANTLLKAIDGKDERTYAYTCVDYEVENQTAFISELNPIFIAARGGGPIPEDMTDIDPYFVPSWGVNDPTGEDLIDYVKQARAKGTVAVFMFHSVGGGYLNVSNEAHEELLKYLDENRDVIWTESFLQVMKWVKDKSE